MGADELRDPLVEVLGTQRQNALAAEGGQLPEVVVDQAQNLVGLGIVEDRPLRTIVLGLSVERDQKGRLRSRQVDLLRVAFRHQQRL